MNASVNPHCEQRWPYSVAERDPLGHGIAMATEAIYGAYTVARLLHADFELSVEIECADNPNAEPAKFTNNVTAGLFAALHTCLDTVNLALEDMPARVEGRDVLRDAAAGKAAQRDEVMSESAKAGWSSRCSRTSAQHLLPSLKHRRSERDPGYLHPGAIRR